MTYARRLSLLCIFFFLSNTQILSAGERTRPKKEVRDLYQSALNSVVLVTAMGEGGEVLAEGSGFAVTNDGGFVTNLHVIRGASAVSVRFTNGISLAATGVRASDESADLAVLQLDSKKSHALIIGDSDLIRVGDEVIAIGNPLGLEATLTTGIVSALRTSEGLDVIQTSAPVSHGSSGGALLNRSGEVIGVITFQLQEGQNLNFAIPSNYLSPLLKETRVLPFPEAQGERIEIENSTDQRTKEVKDANDLLQRVMERHDALSTAAERIHFLESVALFKSDNRMYRAAILEVLGSQYDAVDRDTDAVRTYEKSLKLLVDVGGKSGTLYRRLCGAYVAERRLSEALDVCKAAAENVEKHDLLDWDKGSSQFLLGFVYSELGRFDEAIEAYKRAIQISPRAKNSYEKLIGLYQRTGKSREVKALYESLKTTAPDFAKEVFPFGRPR